MKCIKIREDEYRRLENVGMVCFETKEEANTAIQDLNETTRYIAKEYEPNIYKQEKIHTNMTQGNEKEWKSSQLKTISTEHIAQTT